MGSTENKPTRVNTVLAGGIAFKAKPLGPHGSSCATETRYRERVAEATQGLTDGIQLLKLILRRLDIEAAERGEDAQFPCSAYRNELRAAVRRIDGR